MARSAKLSDADYEAARRRADLDDATEPRAAAGVSCTTSMLTLPLQSGVIVILATASIPGLSGVRDSVKLANVIVEGRGKALHWPELDVDLSVPLLIAEALPIRSPASIGRRGGSATSSAKTAAVRENGKKGGRPRKSSAA